MPKFEVTVFEDIEEMTSKEVAALKKQYLPVMRNLADLTKKKKELDEQEKKVKENLKSAMDKYGIKSIDNDFLLITRVDSGKDKLTVDLDAFKANEPEEYEDLLKDYPKTIKGKAGYVTFKVKT